MHTDAAARFKDSEIPVPSKLSVGALLVQYSYTRSRCSIGQRAAGPVLVRGGTVLGPHGRVCVNPAPFEAPRRLEITSFETVEVPCAPYCCSRANVGCTCPPLTTGTKTRTLLARPCTRYITRIDILLHPSELTCVQQGHVSGSKCMRRYPARAFRNVSIFRGPASSTIKEKNERVCDGLSLFPRMRHVEH